MNYLKLYESIIEKAKSENRIKLKKNHKNYVYYENHHIFPKCLGGNNNEENLVLLTAREHFICHKLLTYIYYKNRAITLAFFRMTYNKRGKLKLSSKDYAFAKELISLSPMSNETKAKIGEGNRGKFISNETKEKTRNTLLGKIHSEERKTNISKSLSGRKLTKEHRENISKSQTGKPLNLKIRICPYYNLSGRGANMTRYHFKNCKYKTS